MVITKYILLFLFAGIFLSCNNSSNSLFERVPCSYSGVTFNNRIQESDSLNILDFEYLYNGGGVGVGDFNNDGLQDIFFSANQGASRLYINEGGLQFKDITAAAGIKTPYWNTGVSIVDINQDGLMDIYLCTANNKINKHSPNQLFLNKGVDKNGNPSFKEVATAVGLADEGYSTQAAFFDYDNDGDLDCYILTNALESFSRALPVGQKKDGTGKSTDRLYRNNGAGANGLPSFSNVSKEAGITIEGWGLGIGVADFNNDGWLDVYCANDFQSNDLLWINNENGTFTNRIADFIQHQSTNSMGIDIADINNDGLPEIVNADMMPEDNLRQKMIFSKPNYDMYQLQKEKKYQPQFVRNSLQLNKGMDKNAEPVFSEIGYYAGIYATDWSWSALFADFDNDGFRDLLITNGYPKDVSNLDFASYTAESLISFTREDKELRKQKMKKMESLLGVKKSNFIFRNKGNLTFEDVTEKWGMKTPSFSNGAAYADFDNDGDLDVVINNINDEAFIYRNNLIKDAGQKKAPKSNYLDIRLWGDSLNRNGFGTKITIFYNDQKQFLQHSPYRGYCSTVEFNIHFGVADAEKIDSVKIEWLNGKAQLLTNVAVNQVINIYEKKAIRLPEERKEVQNTFLSDQAFNYGLIYKHEETDFNDFNSNFLNPHKYSQGGPGIAAADLNGDQLDDIFIGGAMRKPATIFYQQPGGSFLSVPFKEKIPEDMGVLLFDADGDGDNDIYCVSGSSEFGSNKQYYQDRLYRNQGHGKFMEDSAALPHIESSGSCVTACDYDKDGDLDLFVGGRVSPNNYPMPPQSYLLSNNGKGKFADITKAACPELQYAGMVTAALWTDFDNDGWTDLIVVGEFMPITLYKNEQGKLKRKIVDSWQTSTVGWWNSLVGGDFDNDGDMDYVAGNLGLNSMYKASATEPVCVYAKDYNQDGRIDPILCRYIQGKEYPTHYRESLTDQIGEFKKSLFTYESYGNKTFADIFNPSMLEGAYILKATQMASVYIQNNGHGNFTIRPLPAEAQLAPVFGMVCTDLNGDGNLDLLCVGNDYSAETLTGRYDASTGNCFLGDGKGNFNAVEVSKTGFKVTGDAKGFAEINLDKKKTLYAVTQNQDSLKVFENNQSFLFELVGIKANDVFAEIAYRNGTLQKQEFYYGNTYLSQSSRMLKITAPVKSITITNTSGEKRIVYMLPKSNVTLMNQRK